MSLRRTVVSLAVAFGLLFVPLCTPAQNQQNSSQVPVTITVTVLGKNYTPAPPIPKEDVTAHLGGKVAKVVEWVPAPQHGVLQLALLIDENVRTTLLAEQLQEIANFIQDQGPSTAVGVYYAEHGSAYAACPFTTDHAAAAKALRLTLGGNGESPSVYLSIKDLADHWPASSQPARREVLVLASGNDPLSRGIEDPYADDATDATLKAGLNVHALQIAGARYSQSFRGNISAGKLIDLANNSGGQDFGDEVADPVSIAPYLKNLNQALQNQYLLTFLTDRVKNKKGELRDIQVRLEERDVKVAAPKQVLIPGP
jgi:hypothetical protein